MSRAFVREDDGWSYCADRGEACMFAGNDGKCILGYCRQHGEPKPEKEREKEAKTSL